MKKQFYKDRAVEVYALNRHYTVEVLTEDKLATLPQTIQKHYRLCGFFKQTHSSGCRCDLDR